MSWAKVMSVFACTLLFTTVVFAAPTDELSADQVSAARMVALHPMIPGATVDPGPSINSAPTRRVSSDKKTLPGRLPASLRLASREVAPNQQKFSVRKGASSLPVRWAQLAPQRNVPGWWFEETRRIYLREIMPRLARGGGLTIPSDEAGQRRRNSKARGISILGSTGKNLLGSIAQWMKQAGQIYGREIVSRFTGEIPVGIALGLRSDDEKTKANKSPAHKSRPAKTVQSKDERQIDERRINDGKRQAEVTRLAEQQRARAEAGQRRAKAARERAQAEAARIAEQTKLAVEAARQALIQQRLEEKQRLAALEKVARKAAEKKRVQDELRVQELAKEAKRNAARAFAEVERRKRKKTEQLLEASRLKAIQRAKAARAAVDAVRAKAEAERIKAERERVRAIASAEREKTWKSARLALERDRQARKREAQKRQASDKARAARTLAEAARRSAAIETRRAIEREAREQKARGHEAPKARHLGNGRGARETTPELPNRNDRRSSSYRNKLTTRKRISVGKWTLDDARRRNASPKKTTVIRRSSRVARLAKPHSNGKDVPLPSLKPPIIKRASGSQAPVKIRRLRRKGRILKRRRVGGYRRAVRCSGRGRHRIRLPGIYVVQRGDSLWRISRRHYWRGRRYWRIYRANRDKIRNPHLIYPCQRLYIPRWRQR